MRGTQTVLSEGNGTESRGSIGGKRRIGRTGERQTSGGDGEYLGWRKR